MKAQLLYWPEWKQDWYGSHITDKDGTFCYCYLIFHMQLNIHMVPLCKIWKWNKVLQALPVNSAKYNCPFQNTILRLVALDHRKRWICFLLEIEGIDVFISPWHATTRAGTHNAIETTPMIPYIRVGSNKPKFTSWWLVISAINYVSNVKIIPISLFSAYLGRKTSPIR